LHARTRTRRSLACGRRAQYTRGRACRACGRSPRSSRRGTESLAQTRWSIPDEELPRQPRVLRSRCVCRCASSYTCLMRLLILACPGHVRAQRGSHCRHNLSLIIFVKPLAGGRVCPDAAGAPPPCALTLFLSLVTGTGCLLPQLEENESEEEEIEETRMQGRDNIPVYEKTIRCRSGSGWYNLNAQHTLNTTSQTLSSRVPPIDILIQVSPPTRVFSAVAQQRSLCEHFKPQFVSALAANALARLTPASGPHHHAPLAVTRPASLVTGRA